MAEPLIENYQQNIPVNSLEQGYSSNNAQYTGSSGISNQNQQKEQTIPNNLNQPL